MIYNDKMATTEKSKKRQKMVDNDFSDLLQTLILLEKKIRQIDELKRELKKEINKMINQRAILLSGVVSVILVYIYAINYSFLFEQGAKKVSLLASFLQMFLVGFVSWGFSLIIKEFFRSLLSKNVIPGGRKHIERIQKRKFVSKKEAIEKEIDEILNQKVILNSRVMVDLLNSRTLNYLIDAVKTKEVNSIDEAIHLLELEIQDEKAYHFLLPDENVVTYAKHLSL